MWRKGCDTQLYILFLFCAEFTKERWMITCVLGEVFPTFVTQLLPLWQRVATSGTPAQVKLAVRCLCGHINDPFITYSILTVCNFT